VIDIHHHCIPGVDDGPAELGEAVAMCRMAADEGIDTIVATPHVLRGRWPETPRAELERRFAELQTAVGTSPRLLLGSECFFGHDIAELMEGGNSILPLAGSRYVLVEFASNAIPPMVEQPFYRLQLGGWTPVIAHPERNVVFQAKPELLAQLIAHGARAQVTAGSLVGDFGEKAQRAATAWVQRGLVHFLATDAHNTTKRPPRAKAAIAALRELAGDEVAEALTYGNPRCVIENRPLEFEPDAAEAVAHGFLHRLRAFFGA
jgi:protein-tyrosine phosphatase